MSIPTAPLTSTSYLAYCRAGFEPDLVAEFNRLAGTGAKTVSAVAGSGYVWVSFSGKQAPRTASQFQWHNMVFARQCLRAGVTSVALTSNDRVTPIVSAASEFLAAQRVANVGDVRLEYPDTNDGKALSKLAQGIEPLIAQRLKEAGLLIPNEQATRLHVLLTPAREAILALGDVRQTSPWRNGIARLRMPHDAPSRSTLKLAEAIQLFLGENDERLLKPEMRAVDLGAAPGGWTWQLINRGLHVTAVDNGPLKGDLVDNALVRHLREDGFRYRPRKPVDWMVCDMVEKPVRIAQLVAQWMSEGWTERCIFNLKLPMKKRDEEVQRCRQLIADALDKSDRPYELVIKQLYHDREEVTGFCRYVPRSERR